MPRKLYGDGLCGCGCKGVTSKLYGRHRLYLKGHHARSSPVDYLVEDRGHKTPCWIWQRALTIKGYGVMFSSEKSNNRPAHICYYEKIIGPVPEGMELDHLCRVHPCINPEHLEPVTPRENKLRGDGTKLTLAQVQEIRVLVSAGKLQKDVAGKFGVSNQQISKIMLGLRWKDEINAA